MSQALSLTTDPIPKLTWQIALPMSIGMFFNTMFNVVDTFCAGWLGTEALAALSLSFPVFFTVFAVGSGIAQGTTALLSISLGGGNNKDARHVFAQALLFVIVAGVVLSFLGWLAAPWLYRQLGAEGDYLRTSLAYMNVILAGGVFVLLPMVVNAGLSAQGNTLPYRNFLIAGFVVNLLLNPLFILGWFGLPKMGVGGIALATVIVQIGGGLYLWSHVAKSDVYRGIRFHDLKPDREILIRIAGQAVPAALNMLTIAVGVFVITWFVKNFGQEAVAAIGIATRVEQIVLMPSIGLNAAVLSIVGQNYGAGHYDRVREAWLTNVKYGALMMLVGGLLVFFTRKLSMRIFTDDPTVIAHGSDYLISASLTLVAYPILFVTVFALQGLKRPAFGLWMGLYRQLAAPIIVFHLLTFTLGWGLWGVWWGVCMVTWSAAIFALFWGWKKICSCGTQQDD
ncbi:MATE family efflux transporter [Haloferula sp.]|uniref:MATE family efflux transporter n=1 Tax=Haloferula sp. TaxID=2497595 RepID=UPI0032A04602